MSQLLNTIIFGCSPARRFQMFLGKATEVAMTRLVQELLAAKQEVNSFRAKLVEKDTALEKKAKEVSRA